MALDETLLEGYLAGDGASSPPTLRLYSWRPATLSLGKSQRFEDGCDPDYLREQGIGLVRRPTGGQAVLHEYERTYAVVGRLDRAPFDAGVLACYEAISAALRRALSSFGFEIGTASHQPPRPLREKNPVCFAEPSAHELLVDEKKIVGSAQLRRRQAFLQHGSILLRADPTRLQRAIGVAPQPTPMVDLEQLIGRMPTEDELDQALIAGFSEQFALEFDAIQLSVDERAEMTRRRTFKYLSESWTVRSDVS